MAKPEPNPPSHEWVKYSIRDIEARQQAWLKTPDGIAHLEKEKKKEIRRLKFLRNKGLANAMAKLLEVTDNTSEHLRADNKFRELKMELLWLEQEHPDVKGVSPSSIQALRKLMQQSHPDKGGSRDDFELAQALYQQFKKSA